MMRCWMVETVCKRRDRMVTSGQAVGREEVGKETVSGTVNARDGNKTPHCGMVEGNRGGG